VKTVWEAIASFIAVSWTNQSGSSNGVHWSMTFRSGYGPSSITANVASAIAFRMLGAVVESGYNTGSLDITNYEGTSIGNLLLIAQN
jgi:hypothetical protein